MVGSLTRDNHYRWSPYTIGGYTLVEPTSRELVSGNIAGRTVLHKFGHSHTVGTGAAPIAIGNIYRTPQVSGATTVRVKIGNAADTAAGAGARSIWIQGLSATGALQTSILATNGTSAGAASTESYIRIFRAYVYESGTYASSSGGSHVGDITIENSAGTEDWLTISSSDFPRGQSQIGAYTIPLGQTGTIKQIQITVDTSKIMGILFFKRENILETAPPYTGMRTVAEYGGTISEISKQMVVDLGPFPALTDIGYMAWVSTGTAEMSVDFLIDCQDE